MRDKNNENSKRYAFAKKEASTVTILPTKTIVERIKVNGVEQIHVIDAKVVEPPKRPFFFISESILKAKNRLWKLL